MEMFQGKLFQNNKEITIKEYDVKKIHDYYKFVQENHNLGYSQVVITTEIMLNLIEYYFVKRKFNIIKVEFIDEDLELEAEICHILRKLSADRAYWAELSKKLNFLANHESVDIKRVELLDKALSSGSGSIIYCQVNGIISIDAESFENESKVIRSVVEGLLK